MNYSFELIGIVRSPYKEKFGIPSQPGLVSEAEARLELLAPYNRPETVDGLDGYSHIWIQFVFHRTVRDQWQPMVRPPRLGGNKRVGVFASRSPFRPNPLGLFVVRLDSVNATDGKVELMLSGVDLLDGTPVLDIKPYVAYVDSIPDARSGFSPASPDAVFDVQLSPLAEAQVQARSEENLRALIINLLAIDPRPAYSNSQPDRIYGIRLYDFDLRWRVTGGLIEVLELANQN